MNKFLSLLALALLLSTASIAQSVVSFKAMGNDDEPIYGMIGATWGVEWCVVGLDRNWAWNPACKAAKP